MSNLAPADPPVTDSTARAVLYKLDCIEQLLRDTLLDSEQEPDFDVTYTAGGTLAAAAVAVIGPFPRTMKHVEVTLSMTAGINAGVVAVIEGQWPLAQAQQLVNLAATAPGAGNAIVMSGGTTVTVRDYLNGSGFMTVLFSAAYTGFAQVRVRQLDETQARPQST